MRPIWAGLGWYGLSGRQLKRLFWGRVGGGEQLKGTVAEDAGRRWPHNHGVGM